MVDKNLFLYDLALVAILKNEGPYLKEWLDYHLLAGVDHFYLYDNDSSDNQAEIAKPYVERGLVDYFPTPGKAMQFIAYNDAVKRFKFQCRYMTFIDGDEFLYPKLTGGGVIDVIDEIFSGINNAGELGISWQMFGSNGHDKADYSRGVLERFTRRAVNSTQRIVHCKIVTNPRTINFMDSPHCALRFEGIIAIDERKKPKQQQWTIEPPLTEKIVINHYHCKSREEYQTKVSRGSSARVLNHKRMENFESHDCNEEFDDGILKYRDERAKVYQPPDASHANERLLTALMKNLLPTLKPTEPNFYAGKMETFLTCRAVSSYLKTKLTDAEPAKFFEETSLAAILKSVNGMSLADARLLLRESPKLLSLPYPVVKELRGACLQIIPQLMNIMHLNGMWRDYIELDCMQDMLRLGE